ncbi:MAG: CbrC family protein [Tissierellia bacterium]|nr:CbrC family protein [Tissierellia bacterium]
MCENKNHEKYHDGGSILESEKQIIQSQLPYFRYHPDPLATGAFELGLKTCPCCERESNVFYVLQPHSQKGLENICPECIATGQAAEKYRVSFIEDAEMLDPENREKTEELFSRTPGYLNWQGEYWLTCCNDYCAYLGAVGTKELEAMGVYDEVVAEFEARNQCPDIHDWLIKDGQISGYLFQCLHCCKYLLWVDGNSNTSTNTNCP